MSPALAGRFSTTAPPGKPLQSLFKLLLKLEKAHVQTGKHSMLSLYYWDFPGGPVVKKPHSNAGDAVRSLVGELRPHVLWDN